MSLVHNNYYYPNSRRKGKYHYGSEIEIKSAMQYERSGSTIILPRYNSQSLYYNDGPEARQICCQCVFFSYVPLFVVYGLSS